MIMEYGIYMPLTRTYLVRIYQCWVGSHGKQPVLIMVKALVQVPTNEDEIMTASGAFLTEIPSALWSRNRLPFLPTMLQWNIIVGDGDKVC